MLKEASRSRSEPFIHHVYECSAVGANDSRPVGSFAGNSNTDPPLTANESFIVITLFSSHHLKVSECAPAQFSDIFMSQPVLNSTCLILVCLTPRVLTLPTVRFKCPTSFWTNIKNEYRKLCLKAKELKNAHTDSKHPLCGAQACTLVHTRAQNVPVPHFGDLSASFPERTLKAAFTAALCALWSVQELQQCCKYWLLSLLEERASSRRERDIDGERGVKKRVQAWADRWREKCPQVGVVRFLTEAVNLLWLNTRAVRSCGVYWCEWGSEER